MALLWVVGKLRDDAGSWEMQGVFSTEAIALALCNGHADYFIGPIEIDVPFPDYTVPWPNAYMPSETI